MPVLSSVSLKIPNVFLRTLLFPELLNPITCFWKPEVISIPVGLLTAQRTLSSDKCQEKDSIHGVGAAGPALKGPVCLALTKSLRPLGGTFTPDAKFRGGAQAVSGSSVLSSWLGLPYLPAGCRGSTSASTDVLLLSPSFTLHPSCWGQGLSLLVLEGTT